MFRIHHEIKNQQHRGYFLTMTYDEKHVPRGTCGELSLRFYDIQLYLKRLRKAKYYAKYICVGEYGGKTSRPHYHVLLWTDAPVEYLQKNWKSSKDGSVLGTIHFGILSMQSAMYTLKYIIQPKQKFNHDTKVEPTRAQFSKGLGLSYLTTRVYDYHTEDYENPVVFSYIDGKRVALPRYYKNKIFTPYQMREQMYATIEESITEKAKQVRALVERGFKIHRAWAYLKSIRALQSERILSLTKYNTKL